MFCKFCGKKIDDDSEFCMYCGKSLIKNLDNVDVVVKTPADNEVIDVNYAKKQKVVTRICVILLCLIFVSVVIAVLVTVMPSIQYENIEADDILFDYDISLSGIIVYITANVDIKDFSCIITLQDKDNKYISSQTVSFSVMDKGQKYSANISPSTISGFLSIRSCEVIKILGKKKK